MSSNHALVPTATSGLRRLAVPSSLCSSAASQRERYAALVDVTRHSSHNGRYRPYPGTGSAILLARCRPFCRQCGAS